jgi:processive 1,2-diacylglycerol beta-glucosyltransferase
MYESGVISSIAQRALLAPLKKRITVLISNGGGGHIAAAESLTDIFGEEFDIEIVNVIRDVLIPLDHLNRLTGGRLTGEDLYNYFLKRHQSRVISWMAAYGTKHFRPKKIDRAFEIYLKKQPTLPDLIISTCPFVNYGVVCAASRHDIPFLLIPTDLDGSTFLKGFPKHEVPHNFKIAIAYNDPDINSATFEKKQMRPDQVAVTGFPVRSACLKTYSESDFKIIRDQFQLLDNTSTATLIMGALGGNLIFDHVEALCAFQPKAHGLALQINVCTGRNDAIRNKIGNFLTTVGATSFGTSSFRMPSGLIFHLQGFTDKIIDLMAVSDIIITKTGSCTVNEAIYLGKTLLLDNTPKATARHLWWEQFNIPFVQKHGLGLAFTDSVQLNMLLPSLLKFPEKKPTFEKPHFKDNIRRIVKEMVGK